MKEIKPSYEVTIKHDNPVLEIVIIECDIRDNNLLNSATDTLRKYLRKECISGNDILKVRYSRVKHENTNSEKAKILLEFTKIDLAEIKSYKGTKNQILAILNKLSLPEASCKKDKSQNWLLHIHEYNFDEKDIRRTLKKTLDITNVIFLD